MMELDVQDRGGLLRVTLPGDTLDAGNTHDFKRAMEPLLLPGLRLVLDLSRVRFVDSSGCGALLWCLRRLHTGEGAMKLGGVEPRVAELFGISRLDRQIDTFATAAEAVAAFDR